MRKPTTRSTGALLAAAIILFSFGALAADQSPIYGSAEAYTIQFKSQSFLPAQGLDPELVSNIAPSLIATKSDRVHLLVQLREFPSLSQRADLERRGIELLHYVPDHAWIASVPRDIRLEANGFSELRWAGEYLAEYKLTGRVAEREFDGFAVDQQQRVHLAVMFCADVPFERAMDVAELYGGEVINGADAINMLSVALPADEIDSLAADDAVLWVDQVAPGLTHLNDSNRADVGVEPLWAAPYGFDGTGITAFVFDGGMVATGHSDLAGHVEWGQSGTQNSHPTHVAGSIAGNGTGNATYTGMAPATFIYSMAFDGTYPFFYNNPGDIQADYNQAINTRLVDLSNNSIGSNVAWNGNPCSWEGDYESSAALIDSIVRGSLGRRIPIFWAAGNERGGSCGSSFYTSAPPAPNKNAIVIGAINSDDDTMTDFSSWGPTDDGRMRPDVCAPGCQTGGDGGVTSTVPPNGYSQMCGTSMACPTAVGVGSLLIQAWRIHFPETPEPLPATIKAILAQSALDLGNPGPDYKYGYGKIQAVPAVDLIVNQTVLQGSIEQDDVLRYPVEITAEPEFKVTLAWDDAPATPSAVLMNVNNLDLTVIGADGATVYNAWTLNPGSPDAPATSGVNVLDNIEQIVIPGPTPGYYMVQIIGSGIPEGPQDFGLTGTGIGVLSCDGDADGHEALYCGGDDCNDESDQAYPGHEELCEDGIDNDCNDLIDADDPACQSGEDDDDDVSGDDDDDSECCG
ncbi:MAG: S8 family serine peptidase [Candidatus Alcyoniella australis]|nr:S8 family serine peptidase [Candidatus Alcyoniella australis]